MSDFESMPLLLYKMKAAQSQVELSRKELRTFHNENAKLKDEVTTLYKVLNESKIIHNSSLCDQLQEKNFEWENFGIKEMMLQQMLPETQHALEKEKTILEDIQYTVWQERQDFCDLVLEFSNKYGLLAAPKPPPLPIKTEDLAECPVLCAAEADVANLETAYEKIELRLIDYETQEDVIKQELRILKNEASVGNEFVRLQEALKFSEEQCKQIEEECKSFQQMALKNEQDLASVSKGRRQSYYFQPKQPSNPPKYSSIRQAQQRSDYEAEQQGNNPTSEEVHDIHRSRDATFAGHSNRNSNSSFWTEVENTATSSDDAYQHGMLTDIVEQYEEHSSLITNSYLNQGEKKSFIPKTPSAISKKLMLKKDRCLLLEKDLSAMFESPTKPRQADFSKLSSTTSAIATSQDHQGQANLLHTPQHRNSIKSEQDLYRQTENSGNPLRPYIT